MKLNTNNSLVSRTKYLNQKGGKPQPVIAQKNAEEKGASDGRRCSGARREDLGKKAHRSDKEFLTVKAVKKEEGMRFNEAAPRVFSAEFAVGATSLEQVPHDDLPHIAFFGRSNVGKSSMLSALMGKKGLVKISAAPGKTREINFFLVNKAFYFVDLPGIGYAKVSIGLRDKMAAMIREYVEQCANLRGIVYLVDMRHAGTPLDVETVEVLRSLGKPVLLVANKRDKLNQAEAGKTSRDIAKKFQLDNAPIAVSALTQVGFDALWEQILEALAMEG